MPAPMSWKHLLLPALLPAFGLFGAAAERAQNTVILDAAAVANLRLEFAEVAETDFEETIFALGHLEVLPGKRAVVSSRIAGRAFSVLAIPHQQVEAGDEVAWVESRQPGDPPPTVMLAAPISGVVARVDIAQGQPVSPDQALMEIVDLTTVEAAAQVPQHLAGKLQLKQKAHIRVHALPGRVFEAALAHVATLADEASGTIEAAFHVANPDGLLRPGMKAEFSIVADRREGVMAVPRAAVQGDVAGRFVYIKDYELENAFVKTPVVLGAQNDQWVEVTQGLLPGDEVVVRGAYALAFAGKGSVSLKEAMDAAHGHAHNEDGSERGEAEAAEAGHDAADHGHHAPAGGAWTPLTLFFAGTSALLLLLLVLSLALRRPSAV